MKAQRKNRNKPESSITRSSLESREKMITQANKIAAPLCEAEGVELVHIEYQRETSGRILRLYIDKPGGITLDDCVGVSRQFSDLLDAKIETEESYSLEVSSPGSDRPLGKALDFEKFKGNVAKIKTSLPIDGQKKFKGVLLGISEGAVKLLINEKTVAIPFQDIIKARLVNYYGDNRCL
jgi:ribosome maturation factor RimP